MRLIEYFLFGAFLLVFFFLVFRDGGTGANRILSGLADLNVQTFRTLQGR